MIKTLIKLKVLKFILIGGVSAAYTFIAPDTKIDKNIIWHVKIVPITEILRETYIKISKYNSI